MKIPAQLTNTLQKISYLLACLVLLTIPFNVIATNQKQTPLEIGVFPHLSKKIFQDVYQSVADSLANNLSQETHFNKNDNISLFYERLKNEYYDILIIQPFEYIKLREKYSYVPLVTQKQVLKGLIVANSGGAIQTIQNLLGRKLLLPPQSTAVSYLTKKRLHDFGFDLNHDIAIQYEQTHIACLQKLLLSFTDACATQPSALHFFEQGMEVSFQVISQTQAIPQTVFIAHSRLSPAQRLAITNALLQWGSTPSEKKIIKNHEITPFRRITDKDYDIVREIKSEVDLYARLPN